MNIPWLHDWQRAYEQNPRDRAAQIATVSKDHAPEVRTIILRGLHANGAPYFMGDARTDKYRALQHHNQLELCVSWRDTGEQFRLRGHVTCEQSQETKHASIRQALWDAWGEKNRRMCLGAAPGSILTKPLSLDDLPADTPEPPGQFVLFTLIPEKVDHLTLVTKNSSGFNARVVYTLEAGVWRGVRVVA